MIELIRTLYNQGIIAVPTRFGSRQPACEYSHWRTSFPTQADYFSEWASRENGHYPQILCGVGNICVIDVDEKNKAGISDQIINDLAELRPNIYDKMYIEETGTGGVHLWFKMNRPVQTSQIAKTYINEDGIKKVKPFIEILGVGHLCRVHPGDGIKVISRSITSLCTISDQDFSDLLDIIKWRNEVEDEAPKNVAYTQAKPIAVNAEDVSPGDDYASRVDIQEVVSMFENMGWVSKKSNGRILLRRPGAKSRNFDADIKISDRAFISYSSSVNEFVTGTPYSFFATYAILLHNGNYSEAAKALKEIGYGSHNTTSTQQPAKKSANFKLEWDDGTTFDEEEEESDPLWETISSHMDEMWQEYDEKPDITFTSQMFSDDTFSFISKGEFLLIAGREKARKTVFMTSLVAVAKSGKNIIGFKTTSDSAFNGNIVIIDTEQSKRWTRSTAWRIAKQCGFDGDMSQLKQFLEGMGIYYCPLAKIPGDKNKMAAIRKIRERIPNIVAIVIDNIKDMVPDFNDVKSSKVVVDEIMSFRSDKCQCLVVAVIHLNKGERSPRGHAGAFLAEGADAVIFLTYNEDSGDTDVEFARMRDLKPDPFSFSVDKDNIPRNNDNAPIIVHGLTVFGVPPQDTVLSIAKSSRPTEEELDSLYD